MVGSIIDRNSLMNYFFAILRIVQIIVLNEHFSSTFRQFIDFVQSNDVNIYLISL